MINIKKGDKIHYMDNNNNPQTVEYVGIVGLVKYIYGETECIQMRFLHNGSVVHIPVTAWRFLKNQSSITWEKTTNG